MAGRRACTDSARLRHADRMSPSEPLGPSPRPPAANVSSGPFRMKQIPLAIGHDEPPRFDHFVPGANALGAGSPADAGTRRAAGLPLGPSGSGKTHLLQATARPRVRNRRPCRLVRRRRAGAVGNDGRVVADRLRRLRPLRRRRSSRRPSRVRRGDGARPADRRGRQRAAGRPAAPRRPAQPPRLGSRVRVAAADRARGARRAAPGGRPARRLPLRRSDGLPVDAIRARPEAPDGTARPARRVRARQQARAHGAAAEADARRRGRAERRW